MTQAVVKMLKKVVDLSNANFVKNADGLLAKRTVEQEVEWIGKDKKRLPDNHYKMSYWLFFSFLRDYGPSIWSFGYDNFSFNTQWYHGGFCCL